MQLEGKKKRIRDFFDVLCFIASGRTHQLAREFEIWAVQLEKNKFQQVEIVPVK